MRASLLLRQDIAAWKSLPCKVAALIDLCKINACPLLCPWSGDFQHPGGRVETLLQGRNPLDALQEPFQHEQARLVNELICLFTNFDNGQESFCLEIGFPPVLDLLDTLKLPSALQLIQHVSDCTPRCTPGTLQ